MFAGKIKKKLFPGLVIMLMILFIIYFISIPKILMIGYPSEMVYQYNGPFIFDNFDAIGNQRISNLTDFSNYDILIFTISSQVIIKYHYNEKLKNFSGIIIGISNSEKDISQLSIMSPQSKVYRFDHIPSFKEIMEIR